MRVVVLCLLLAALVYAVLSPIIRRGEKPSFIILGMILVPFLAFGIMEARWQFYEAKATAIVKEVSGKAAGHAKCQRLSASFFDPGMSTKGMVYFSDTNTAHLKYSTCQDFISWMQSDKQSPTFRQAMSVGVIAHEGIHVSGEFNEANTECKAQKKLAAVAQRMGATSEQANSLVKIYVEDIHPRMPAQYLNGVC